MSDDEKDPEILDHGELIERDEKIVAAVDKDAFRAMFYLFAGKPDTKHQTYRGKVLLRPDDLVNLNDRVQEKFRLHNIDQVITTVSLSLDNNQSLDFGTWIEFMAHDWRDPAAVNSLTIRWDFLLKLRSYAQPQRHVLTVDFSSGLNPTAMLRIVLEAVDSPQELDMSKMFGGCIAKVDFISHALADELLALVGKWHSVLPKSVYTGSILEKCEKNDDLIATVIRRSVTIAAAIVGYFSLDYLTSTYDLSATITVAAMRDFCLWILGAIILLWASSGVGKFIGVRAYRSITNYGAYHVFRFTTGDERAAGKLVERNRKSAIRFFWAIGYALSLHVVAGLLIAYLIGLF